MLRSFPTKRISWCLLPLVVVVLLLAPAASAYAESPRDEVTVEGQDRSTSQVPGSGAVDVPEPGAGNVRQTPSAPGTQVGPNGAEGSNAPRPATPRESQSEWWASSAFWIVVGVLAGIIVAVANND